MLLGALEITGFLAQRDSLDPLGLLGAVLAAPLPKAVFISIMSFAYYRQSAKCQLSPPCDSLPFLLLLSFPVLWRLWVTGTQEAAFLNRFLLQFFMWNKAFLLIFPQG